MKPGLHPDFFRRPPPAGRSRESSLRIDAQGCFWHEGERVEHPRLQRALAAWLDRHPDDGRYILNNGYDWSYVQVDATPFVVRTLGPAPRDSARTDAACPASSSEATADGARSASSSEAAADGALPASSSEATADGALPAPLADERAAPRDVGIWIELSDGSREGLDPRTLGHDEAGALYCRVKAGRFDAKFTPAAQLALEPWLVELQDGVGLRIAGRTYRSERRA